MTTIDTLTRDIEKIDQILSRRSRPYDPINSRMPYQSLVIVKKLSKGKFPLYLATSKINNQKFAMKVFPYVGEECHAYYKNEVRFSPLKHPNVINIVYHEERKNTIQKGEVQLVSYILMEYAPYGDFFDIITHHKEQFDDKLARTYFRQLIDGIEYLHGNGVAHLDLKPENILLSADFNLKIADFDLSYIFGDNKILSRGTRYYRAPEFFRSTSASSSSSENVALADPFAADIYSAGIILFILKTGMYPHSENKIIEGLSFMDLMYKNNMKFWVKHCEIQGREKNFFSLEFRDLFNNMVKMDPSERLSLKQIKQSRWYNGQVYSPWELEDKMNKILQF